MRALFGPWGAILAAGDPDPSLPAGWVAVLLCLVLAVLGWLIFGPVGRRWRMRRSVIATGEEFQVNGRRFIAPFPTTLRYVAGTLVIGEGRFEDALAILGQEPAASPCYGMALGHMALAHLSREDAPSAEASARGALVEMDRHGLRPSPHPRPYRPDARPGAGDQPEKLSECLTECRRRCPSPIG